MSWEWGQRLRRKSSQTVCYRDLDEIWGWIKRRTDNDQQLVSVSLDWVVYMFLGSTCCIFFISWDNYILGGEIRTGKSLWSINKWVDGEREAAADILIPSYYKAWGLESEEEREGWRSVLKPLCFPGRSYFSSWNKIFFSFTFLDSAVKLWIINFSICYNLSSMIFTLPKSSSGFSLKFLLTFIMCSYCFYSFGVCHIFFC